MKNCLPTTYARFVALACWGLLLLANPGCSTLLSVAVPSTPQSLLKTVETAPESVALEIFHVRYPASDKELQAELWQAVDEQRLGVEVRHELVRNGFRMGVLGGTVPDRLAQYMKLESELPEQEVQRLITGESADPSVTRRVLQLNRHEPATVKASELQDSLHVLMNEAEGLRGRSYQQVEAVYSLRAESLPGQRVQLRLVPELQHGELKNRYVPSDQGIFLMTRSRERELFDQLELNLQLTPGEMLVLGGLPDASGTLGHAFHAENQRGPAELKLVLVRLLEVPGSEILADQ